MGVTVALRARETTESKDAAKVGGADCGRRPLLHRLCRWALPAAFALGALALWLGSGATIGLALVGLVLAICPLVCVFLLFWEGRESKRIASTADRSRRPRWR